MIAFDHGFNLGQRKCVVYIHWAVYVDNEPLNGRNGNIFHMSGQIGQIPISGCQFGTYQGGGRTRNYRDQFVQYDIREQHNNIVRRINQLNRNCGYWNPFTNNCEHIATSVRYGERLSLQEGALAAMFFRNNGKRSILLAQNSANQLRAAA
ncbi:hypothetical protein SRHO_G00335530 [Serrasalmus rhombeus]